MFLVEPAVPCDVRGVSTVILETWRHELLSEVFLEQVRSESASVWVARQGRDVVGFVSAFETAGHGVRRWEVDLLAVLEFARGQGIGSRLISEVCQQGAPEGLTEARAAVRMGNVGGEKAFRVAGFSTDDEPHLLLIWEPKESRAPGVRQAAAALLPVSTLTYRGLWIEGLAERTQLQQCSALAIARNAAARRTLDSVGAMVPAAEIGRLAPHVQAEANLCGAYHWYRRPMTDPKGGSAETFDGPKGGKVNGVIQ